MVYLRRLLNYTV
ncbi:hypothetical protein KSF78_0009211 [Schistosoma japonicum]|nr:hypothetical protein KSF78_0009211 [Schistosoma japonicum]